MMTFLLILAAVVLVVLTVAVLVDCCRSPFAWVLHTCCGTVGAILELLAAVVAAIFEALAGASR